MRFISCTSEILSSSRVCYPTSEGVEPRKESENQLKSSKYELPVLDMLVNQASKISADFSLKKTTIVCIHHSLKTSISLVKAVLGLGVKAENFFILGKSYSDCPDVVQSIKNLGVSYQMSSKQNGVGCFYQTFIKDVSWLWRKVFDHATWNTTENLLILDHGGHALSFIPDEVLSKYHSIIGVEKTSAGLINFEKNSSPYIPVINVASCAAKKFLEPEFIAKSLIDNMPDISHINGRKAVCGIIGCGAIGKAVAKQLLFLGFKVMAYDRKSPELEKSDKVSHVEFLTTIISEADYIFGCTGTDILSGEETLEMLETTSRDKIFLSCSSEDKEFLSLLLLVKQKSKDINLQNPLHDITYTNKNKAKITFLKGGFPINFNTFNETVPPEDIQLTRALVFLSVLQAAKLFREKNLSHDSHALYKLDPEMQKIIVNKWLKCQPDNKVPTALVRQFQDIDWVAENSEGQLKSCDIF